MLDAILQGLVEEELSVDEIVARGFDRATVTRVQRLLYLAEYKRRQAPPGVKISSASFGRDRRYPITNGSGTVSCLFSTPGERLSHHRPLRAVADRAAARRQHPHRADQLAVRQAAGRRFLLRIDDTDLERSTEEYERGHRGRPDLARPDLGRARQPVRARSTIYEAAADELKAQGRLYPCYETAEELDRRRKVQLARGKPPIYDRAALKLTDDGRAKLRSRGPQAALALQARRQARELERPGPRPVRVDTTSMSDPVLIREDGAFLYTLPSVVDDVEFGITHVIRGEDHVTNTGAQIEIFEALGATPPQFAHFPLLVGADGAALSKRLGSLSISELRDEGFEPMAVHQPPRQDRHLRPGRGRAVSLEPLAELRLRQVRPRPGALRPGRPAPAQRRRPARHADYATAKPRLAALGADLGEAFWNAVRANLELFERRRRAGPRWCSGPVTPGHRGRGLPGQGRATCCRRRSTPTTWKTWTDAVKAETGAKGSGLFMPLRQALTGLDHGPDMGPLLPLIGRENAAEAAGGRGGLTTHPLREGGSAVGERMGLSARWMGEHAPGGRCHPVTPRTPPETFPGGAMSLDQRDRRRPVLCGGPRHLRQRRQMSSTCATAR